MSKSSYQDLEVWRFSMSLAAECYKVTQNFPRAEMFGLTNQIRRAAVSIPANIAEGQGRDHIREFLHHLSIAKGSMNELETHLMLSQRIGILDEHKLQPLLEMTQRVGQMLTKLCQALKKRL